MTADQKRSERVHLRTLWKCIATSVNDRLHVWKQRGARILQNFGLLSKAHMQRKAELKDGNLLAHVGRKTRLGLSQKNG